MVKETKEKSIFIHLCVCDGFMDEVSELMQMNLVTVIMKKYNWNITPSIKQYPFCHTEKTHCKIAGWNLKITIPVKIHNHAILKEWYGKYYYFIKYIYSEKLIMKNIEDNIYEILNSYFYYNNCVALNSNSIKKILITNN